MVWGRKAPRSPVPNSLMESAGCSVGDSALGTVCSGFTWLMGVVLYGATEYSTELLAKVPQLCKFIINRVMLVELSVAIGFLRKVQATVIATSKF